MASAELVLLSINTLVVIVSLVILVVFAAIAYRLRNQLNKSLGRARNIGEAAKETVAGVLQSLQL